MDTSSPASPGTTTALSSGFQDQVGTWLHACFGLAIAHDLDERNDRFLEEALELFQACGGTIEAALGNVLYVFGRAVGERSQEVGGVMVTLAAQKLDMSCAAETELARIQQPEIMERIRQKQLVKPSLSTNTSAYPDRLPFTADIGVAAQNQALRAHIQALCNAAMSEGAGPQQRAAVNSALEFLTEIGK